MAREVEEDCRLAATEVQCAKWGGRTTFCKGARVGAGGGVTARRWNGERFIVFQSVILQRSGEAKKAKDIRARIQWRLKEWMAGKYDMLVQDTVRTSMGLMGDIRRGQTEEQISKTFTRMVLQVKIRQAVRFAIERGQWGH